MPIYEFRCLSCNHYFELLSVRKDDTLEMKCPSCEAEEVERVLSCVSYVIGSRGGTGHKHVVSGRQQHVACSLGSLEQTAV